MRLAWIHRELGVLEHLLGAARLSVGERDPHRRGEEDLAVVEGDGRAQRLAQRLGEGDDALGLALRQQNERELVAGEARQRVLRLQQAAEPARERQQDRVADRDADGIVDLLEAVEIDHDHGRLDRRVGLGEGEHAFEAVEEQLAVGQPGEVVVHRVVQQPLFRVLELGDVGERADEPHHLAVRSDHRPRLDREPEVMAVGRAQPEVLGQPSAALLQHAVEHGAEAVAVERMQHLEPARRRSFERAALEAEQRLGLRAGEDLVGRDVPVPDHVAGAGQRERAALDVGDDAGGHAAGKGVLHHGEADQHHDQHQAAEQRRADDVVGDGAADGERRRHHPDHQQEPGRDQQHGAVEAEERQIDDETEAEHRDGEQRDARDARRDRRLVQRERDQHGEEGEPADGDVRVAHVPAVEVEIGEQEHHQRRRQDRLARCAPDLLVVGRQREHLAPEAEVDADIDENRPAERGGGGEHDRALDHEQDGQEQREQAGDPDHDAVVERDAVDLVLVGFRLPQIELVELVRAQLQHVGHDAAGIERDAEDVGGRAVLAVGALAARGDAGDARAAEIGPEHAGADHAVMRHDDEALDLLVAGIGEREHRPVGVALARAHVHAADDAIGSGRGGDQEPVGVGAVAFGCVGEIDRGCVGAHVDGLDGARGREADHHDGQHRRYAGADENQPPSSQLHPVSTPHAELRRTDAIPRAG